MIIADTHCDTITEIMQKDEGLYKNHCHADISRMLAHDGYIQFFAAFIEDSYGQAYAMKRALTIFDKLFCEIEANDQYIEFCRNSSDIENAVSKHKVAAVLSVENGIALQGEIAALRIFYKLGVRSICLTWNGRNEIADGVRTEASGGGLTPFGRDVVKEMNRLGMLVDISHMAEKGFWDTMEISSAPIIASHSNVKAVCGHPRNLTDEQFRALMKKGGVAGINLCPDFLNESGNASLADIIKHIEHMASLGGLKHIGIGADFDGIENTPEDVRGIQDIHFIFEELARLNYKDEDISAIAGGNFLRVIKQVLG